MLAILGYQRVGSPIMRHVSACRFTPSCSHYALQALEAHGFYKGNARIAKRLLLCSPIGLLFD
ncbi:MAG: membrane protein insertion efficiency factor YidD [Acidobacteria bacterium]|nr:MAG: membrane protein insertion efficiency factor YidD [Acidobacteriota bacterium]